MPAAQAVTVAIRKINAYSMIRLMNSWKLLVIMTDLYSVRRFYWGGICGSMTSFMDRAFYADLCGKGGRFLLKPAASVISARRAGTTATWDQINKYFALMQMPIISSRYWTIVHGAKAEDVQQDIEGIQTMRILGKNMAYFLKCKDIATKMGISMPEQETAVLTNFIR